MDFQKHKAQTQNNHLYWELVAVPSVREEHSVIIDIM